MKLTATKDISPYQFAVFRIIFGLYLTVHFANLLPYGTELFSYDGVISDPRLNPLHGIFLNPLVSFGSPFSIKWFLGISILLSTLFTLGICRRPVSLMLWFVWACLFNRNNLISNPGIPYVGLILVMCAVIPSGDELSINPFTRRRNRGTDDKWFFPGYVYWGAWILLAAGYTFSGIIKLQSPSWENGEAIRMLLENPLARPSFLRDLFLESPEILLKAMTWGALGIEIVFVFASFHRLTRLWAWLLMIGMHLGIVMLVDFADLTLGMLMIHFFVLDPDWFRSPRKLAGKKNIVFFDGVCHFCNKTIKFLVKEDRSRMLYYSSLQGETFQSLGNGELDPNWLKSIVFFEAAGETDQRMHTGSSAVARLLICMGGFWQIVGRFLWAIPGPVRDFGYEFIASRRYKWFGKYDEVCAIPDPSERERFI